MPVLNSSSSYLDSISTTIIVQYNQRSFAAHANKQKPPLLRFACKRQRHTLECIVSKRTAIHFVECSPSPNRKRRTQTESRATAAPDRIEGVVGATLRSQLQSIECSGMRIQS